MSRQVGGRLCYDIRRCFRVEELPKQITQEAHPRMIKVPTHKLWMVLYRYRTAWSSGPPRCYGRTAASATLTSPWRHRREVPVLYLYSPKWKVCRRPLLPGRWERSSELPFAHGNRWRPGIILSDTGKRSGTDFFFFFGASRLPIIRYPRRRPEQVKYYKLQQTFPTTITVRLPLGRKRA